jgi:hypothetical protein
MTSPTRSKEADAVAILRSGGPFAESLTSAAKHAYAATWVEGGAREHLVKLMLNDWELYI